MKKLLLTVLLLALVLAALRLAGDSGYWNRYAAALAGVGAEGQVRQVRPRLRVPGQVQSLARATPEAENLIEGALEEARQQAVRQGVWSLVVHRHGHRVFEYFEAGRNGDIVIAGGELAAVPFVLAAGVLADNGRTPFAAAVQALQEAAAPVTGWRNPWSRAARQRFSLRPAPALLLQDAEGDVANTLSQRVWMPLGASDAWLWGRDDTALRVDCCMVARLDDWMRVGDLLLGQGSHAGVRLVSPDWIRHVLARDADGHAHPVWLGGQAGWSGDEAPVERDTYWFDLGDDLRVWLAPRRGLQVLVWAGGGLARDTLIPNIILRGLNDQAPAIGGGDLHDLVPGH